MPIYEYSCKKCEREFEAEQRITDDPLKTCPHCRSRRVKRLISQTSFLLKGSGWHSDLYSSPSGKSDSDDGKSESGETKNTEKKTGDADKKSSKSKDQSSKDSGKSKGKGGKAAA
ncbi:MAG: zinc ribbon domain-containing protein [Deltaproteobacteria bacterium]|nr:zinc ribbon domain-containing protein [Deltaproteobacteria bacterium]MBW2359923.1 zinc ribbon domain-containing protein [Deltaproteobacteria bacterium]